MHSHHAVHFHARKPPGGSSKHKVYVLKVFEGLVPRHIRDGSCIKKDRELETIYRSRNEGRKEVAIDFLVRHICMDPRLVAELIQLVEVRIADIYTRFAESTIFPNEFCRNEIIVIIEVLYSTPLGSLLPCIPGHLRPLMLLKNRSDAFILNSLQLFPCAVRASIVDDYDLHVDLIVALEATLNRLLHHGPPVVGRNDYGNIRTHLERET
jgi:hypothetical protein